MSHSVAKLRKGPHLFHKISGIEKTYGQEGLGGSTTISCQKFLSHSVAKLRKGPHLFHKISGIEKTYGQEGLGGGSITIFCQNFIGSQCCKTSPFCFTKFLVLKKFMDERGWGGGEELVSPFFVESFLSHSAEILVEESFCALFEKLPGS